MHSKLTYVLGASFLLLGCSTTVVPPPQPAPVVVEYHPPWPDPLQPCPIKWETFNINNKPYVALSFEDNLNFAICGQDMRKYILETRQIICHYRRSLSEPQCKEINVNSITP